MNRDKGIESEDMSSVNLRRSIVGAAIMAKVAVEMDVPLRELLRGTNIRREDLDDAHSTITFEQEFRLIRNLISRCEEPVGIGMKIGCRYRFTSLAPAGFALVSSPNFRSAFDIMLRYADLNASLVQVCLEEAQDTDLCVGFMEERLPEDIREFAVERTMGVALAIARDLLERDVVPREIMLRGHRPAETGIFRRLTGATPLFESSRSLLVLNGVDVDEPLARHNPLALRLAEDQCRQYLAAWKARYGLAGRVRDVVARTPRKMPSMSEIASTLCISIRTLRRRLEDEGVTYVGLCNEVRQAMAEQMLAMHRLPIEQIAERLGYSESASFTHAFRRWTGKTPQSFRRERILASKGK